MHDFTVERYDSPSSYHLCAATNLMASWKTKIQPQSQSWMHPTRILEVIRIQILEFWLHCWDTAPLGITSAFHPLWTLLAWTDDASRVRSTNMVRWSQSQEKCRNELRRLTMVTIPALSFPQRRLPAHVCIHLPIQNNSESKENYGKLL